MQDETKARFIDESLAVHVGQDALSRLKEKSDAQKVDAANGVTQVDAARWEEAQRYERRTWLQQERGATEDRNEYHRGHFANYAALRGRRFRRAIELGCGPFTNMRVILPVCQIDEVHLLDPLLSTYLEHPYCAYRNGRLGGLPEVWRCLRGRMPPATVARALLTALRPGGLRGRPVHRETAPIESYEPRGSFDLVVMINVLEHCQDARRVFRKIRDLMAPGGIFVFADVLYDAAQIAALSAVYYDAGHPLHVDRSVIDGFLGDGFDLLMRAEYARRTNLHGLLLKDREVYFIGKRL